MAKIKNIYLCIQCAISERGMSTNINTSNEESREEKRKTLLFSLHNEIINNENTDEHLCTY